MDNLVNKLERWYFTSLSLTSFLREKFRVPSNSIACDNFEAWNLGRFANASESLSPPRAGLSPSAPCVDFVCRFQFGMSPDAVAPAFNLIGITSEPDDQ
jgi:hypothetical protein